MTDEIRSKVVNIAVEPHKKFRRRCFDSEISMSKRVTFLVTLDNFEAIPYKALDEKKKLKSKKEIEEIAKRMRKSTETAKLAKILNITPNLLARIEVVSKEVNVEIGLMLEHFLSQERGG
jgi:hypothetical protein